ADSVNEAIDQILVEHGIDEEIDWEYGFDRRCLQRTGKAWDEQNRSFILAKYDFLGDPDRSVALILHPSVDLDLSPVQYDVDVDICTMIRGEVIDYHAEYFPVLKAEDWIKGVFVEFIQKMDKEDYFNRKAA